MSNFRLIRDIQNGKLTDGELLICLDVKHNYVLINCIRKIVQLKISSTEVIEKLAQNGALLSDENRLMGRYKVGHVSLSALYILNTNQSIARYHLEMDKLTEWDRECCEKISNSDFFD